MKPVAFEYLRPGSLAEAAALLHQHGDAARVIAGGQSLGPMLNLRLARPGYLIDVSKLDELVFATESADAITVGAAVTHAAIEDGLVPDIGLGILPSIASRIAYRAVRNRGTIGGSLSHADPAADWVSAMPALGAVIVTWTPEGGRRIPAAEFMTAAFTSMLQPGEIVRAVTIPRLSSEARWGWYKICRKPGEFAKAIGAALLDPGRGIERSVIGATGGRPQVSETRSIEAAALHRVALTRAWEACSS